jgi:cytochrome c oxidase assembly protein subunit 15
VTGLHRYAVALACATLLLVAAGGMVTSTNSGLSVPDWPTTYGKQMFAFPLHQMVGGIFYEHGHRLIASTVGMLTIGLVIILWRVERRRWMVRLGFAALGVVVLQGVLGGLTVLYMLPPPISIGHASLAQLFFCLTVSIALLTSRGWISPAAPSVDDAGLRRRSLTLAICVYVQILLGATMRHMGAGLAIPDFPLMFGHVWPPVWSPAIGVHFAHRAMAAVITILAIRYAWHLRRAHGNRRELMVPAGILLLAIAAQITLGALVVLTGKQPIVNTIHVATGAIVFATTVVLTLRSYRARFHESRAASPQLASSHV